MITAIGNPVFDYIETRKVRTPGRILSGCSTNAAIALTRMGVPTKLIGAVGNDFKGRFIHDLNRIGIAHTLRPSRETGGFSLVYYDDFGNRTLDLLGRADPIGLIEPSEYWDSKAILIGPILSEISAAEIEDIRANFPGPMMCDPQGLLRGAETGGRIFHEKPDWIEETLGLFEIVKPNELEGKVLTGLDCRENPYRAAEIIHSWGSKIVIVTLAELGSVIYDGSEFLDIPPYNIDLVDATGAGDTYMAGFMFEYLRTGGDLWRSGCFASCTSSIMIENIGPDFEMTEELIRNRQRTLLSSRNFKVAVAVNA